MSNFTCIPKTAPNGGRVDEAYVGFGEAGQINFNRAAIRILELESGSQVQFERNGEDWYVRIATPGFPVRPHKNNKSLVLNHKLICKHVLELVARGNGHVKNLPAASRKDRGKALGLWNDHVPDCSIHNQVMTGQQLINNMAKKLTILWYVVWEQ